MSLVSRCVPPLPGSRPEGHLGQAEPVRALGREADVTRERDLQAAAERMAGDIRDEHLRRRRHLPEVAWLMRIMSMLASTSPSRKRLMSAPAEKNFGLAALDDGHTSGAPSASSTASENSVMNAKSYELAGGWSSVMKPRDPSLVNVTAMGMRALRRRPT